MFAKHLFKQKTSRVFCNKVHQDHFTTMQEVMSYLRFSPLSVVTYHITLQINSFIWKKAQTELQKSDKMLIVCYI